MEPWSVLLALVLIALSGTLTVVALSAGRRFEDGRVLWVGVTFGILALVGGLALLSELTGFADEAFAVEPGPLLLLVVAVAVLYAAFFRSRRPPRPADG